MGAFRKEQSEPCHDENHFLFYLHFWYNLPNTHIALVLEVTEQSLLFNIAPLAFLM